MGWIDPRFNPNCATKYLHFICQRFGNIYHFDPQTKFKTWTQGGLFLACSLGNRRRGEKGWNWPGNTAQKWVRVCSGVVDFLGVLLSVHPLSPHVLGVDAFCLPDFRLEENGAESEMNCHRACYSWSSPPAISFLIFLFIYPWVEMQ